MILTIWEWFVCVCVCVFNKNTCNKKWWKSRWTQKKKKKKRLTLKHLSKTKLIITFKLHNQGVGVFIAICIASSNNVFWICSLLKILLKKNYFFERTCYLLSNVFFIHLVSSLLFQYTSWFPSNNSDVTPITTQLLGILLLLIIEPLLVILFPN